MRPYTIKSILTIMLCIGIAFGFTNYISGCSKSDSTEVTAAAPIYGPAPEPTPAKNIAKIDGREIESPSGSGVVYRSTTVKKGSGVGASLKTDNAETAAQFRTSAPSTAFGDDSSTGGLLDANFAMKFPKGTNPLLWVGVLCFLGAGGSLYLGLKRAALFLGIGGAGFIAASLLPGAALLIVCLLALIGAGVYIYSEHKGMHFWEASRALVGGIATMPADIKAQTEKAVADQATHRDARTILDVKAHDNLS